ncbi:NADH dehydrogenase [ubiquinone] 1 alpha subcomplex subunit 2 [Lates japonicus]
MAAAVVRSLGSSLGKNVREIRVQLCQTSAASKGGQRLCGAALRLPEEGQPRLPDPDQRVFWSPGPTLGPIRLGEGEQRLRGQHVS